MTKEELNTFLDGLKLGSAQEHEGLKVYPILSAGPEKAKYIGLDEALSAGRFAVSEVSQGGEVPNLQVDNTGEDDVLVLDGQELMGAKQNRILNATILVMAVSKMTVPVSCTEAGRWAYASREFSSSGHMAERRVRTAQRQSVANSLASDTGFRSDQGEVWNKIDEMHSRARHHSPTSAMRDVLENSKERLDAASKVFTRVDGQHGFIAVAPDGFIGMDYVSREDLYEGLHERLIQSYLFDTLWGSTETPASVSLSAEEFLKGLVDSAIEIHPSPGRGEDVRLSSSDVCGAALNLDGEIIHLGAFSQPGGAGSIGGSRLHRRHWRMGAK